MTNSTLVDNVVFKNGATTRMTTSNRYDNLNRLTLKDSRTGILPVSSFAYAYNPANQRTAITNTDSSRWAYGYDSLGQVTSGKRYWSDGTIVAGQQFEYTFDDIGNRLTAASGGDTNGANLRSQNYSANSLNQYTQRTVPPYVDVQGSATNTATVTVNLQSTYRKGDYFRAELNPDNSVNPVYLSITNVAVLNDGGNPDIITTNQGNVLVAKATEAFLHDLDGNLTSDSLWTNLWNGENRLIATESASAVPSGGKAKETWSHLPDGRWIERVIYGWNGSAYVAHTTNRFVWDGQVLLAITDHTNGLVTSFVRGLDLSGSLQGAGGVGGVLAVNIATNGVHFCAYDGNGNVSALISSTNGAVTANYEYSPFGETLRAEGVVARANPIRFSTQFADEVTGDLKYLFRENRPPIGRWLSRDPSGELGELRSSSHLFGASLNLYVFVENHPTFSTDLFGLAITKEDGAAKLAAVAGKMKGLCRECITCSEENEDHTPGAPRCRVTNCEKTAQAIVNALVDTWNKNFGRGNATHADAVGGYFCWSWADAFHRAAARVVTDGKHSPCFTLSTAGADQINPEDGGVHWWLELQAGFKPQETKAKRDKCTLMIDDGFTGKDVLHEPGWPDPAAYRRGDKVYRRYDASPPML